MSDDLTQAVNDHETTDDQASSGNEDVTKLRQEAAKWRTKFRETEKTVNELKPLAEQFKTLQDSQKSEAQKMADELAEAKRKAAEHETTAQRAVREAKLIRLATKAGVDPDVALLLDLSKLDLDDEKATTETLGKLAAARQTANSASNPARSNGGKETDDELRSFYFGGARSKPTIFGG